MRTAGREAEAYRTDLAFSGTVPAAAVDNHGGRRISRGCGHLLDVDRDEVADRTAVAVVVERHDGVVEDLVGPWHASHTLLLGTVGLGPGCHRCMDEDALLVEVLLRQAVPVGVAADLVARSWNGK